MTIPKLPGVYGRIFHSEEAEIPVWKPDGRTLVKLQEEWDLLAVGLLRVNPINQVNLLLAAEQELGHSLDPRLLQLDIPSCVGHGVVLGETYHELDYQLLAVRKGDGLPLAKSLAASVLSQEGLYFYRLGYQEIEISDAWALASYSVAKDLSELPLIKLPAITVTADGGIYSYIPHCKMGMTMAKLVFTADAESQRQLDSFMGRFYSGVTDVYNANKFTPPEATT